MLSYKYDWAPAGGWVIDIASAEWLVAVPNITARMLSLSASASSNLFKTTVPTPSALQYPSAFASKVLQPPVLERNIPRLRPAKISGAVRTFTPPARAVSHSPAHRDVQAIWIAASEEEQA